MLELVHGSGFFEAARAAVPSIDRAVAGLQRLERATTPADRLTAAAGVATQLDTAQVALLDANRLTTTEAAWQAVDGWRRMLADDVARLQPGHDVELGASALKQMRLELTKLARWDLKEGLDDLVDDAPAGLARVGQSDADGVFAQWGAEASATLQQEAIAATDDMLREADDALRTADASAEDAFLARAERDFDAMDRNASLAADAETMLVRVRAPIDAASPASHPIVIPTERRPDLGYRRLGPDGMVPQAPREELPSFLMIDAPPPARRGFEPMASMPATGSVDIAATAPRFGEVLATLHYTLPQGRVSMEQVVQSSTFFPTIEQALEAASLQLKGYAPFNRLVTPRASGGWDLVLTKTIVETVKLGDRPLGKDAGSKLLEANWQTLDMRVPVSVDQHSRRIDAVAWGATDRAYVRTPYDVAKAVPSVASLVDLELGLPIVGQPIGSVTRPGRFLHRAQSVPLTARNTTTYVGVREDIEELARTRVGAHVVLHVGPDTFAIVELDLGAAALKRLHGELLEHGTIDVDERAVLVTAKPSPKHQTAHHSFATTERQP